MPKSPVVNLVPPNSTAPAPSRKLGDHGQRLWERVHHEYQIGDAAGIEMLTQVCAALDRAEEAAALIAQQGATVMTPGGYKEHPLLKIELASRGFIVRTLAKLGLDAEPLKQVGRPPQSSYHHAD